MDPIWIDANSLMRIAEGDTALEGELLAMRAAGREILVVPKVWEEATVGNPFRANRPAPNMNAETVRDVQAAFTRLSAVHDRSGTAEDRANFALRGLAPGQLPSARHEGDFVVLSQIAASATARRIAQPKLFSLDAAMRGTHSPRWGITGVTRTTTPTPRLTATTGVPGGGAGGAKGGGKGGGGGGPLGGAGAMGAVAGAGILIRNGLTQYSLDQAGREAMDAYNQKKPEIERLQMTYKAFSVRLDFYFQFQPGQNGDFADTHRFEELTVASMATGFQGAMYDTLPRGNSIPYTHYLPALRPDLKALQPAAGPRDPLYQAYLRVRRAVESSEYAEAFGILNSSPMYAILRIVDLLAKDKMFNLLNNLLPSAAGVNTPRLKAAFGAVRASWGSGAVVSSYKSNYSKEFLALPQDQQQNIEDFLKLRVSAATEDVVGRWRVQVHKWSWVYEFSGGKDGGYVRWTDPFNKMTGQGSWKLEWNRIAISWFKSKTKEDWYLPIDSGNQTGKCVMEEGAYALKAVKEKK